MIFTIIEQCKCSPKANDTMDIFCLIQSKTNTYY